MMTKKDLIIERMKRSTKKRAILYEFSISSEEYLEIYNEWILKNKENRNVSKPSKKQSHRSDIIAVKRLSKEIDLTKCETMMKFISTPCDSMINEISKYNKMCGVYFIINKDEEVIYVGVSYNVGARAIQSFSEVPYANGIKIVCTNSRADANILEIYYINKINPIYNVNGCGGDDIGIRIDISEEYSYQNKVTYINVTA